MAAENDNSLLSDLLGGLAAALATIGGFISAQVWRLTRELPATRQSLEDLISTINRMHNENLNAHDALMRRIEKLEDRRFR